MSTEPQTEDKQDNNTLAKVAVGAAVLSNKDVRENISEGVDKVAAHGAQVLHDLTKQFDYMKDKVEKAVADTQTSKAAVTLQESVTEVGTKLGELKDAAAEDTAAIIDDIKHRMDKLRKDYEEMMKGIKAETEKAA